MKAFLKYAWDGRAMPADESERLLNPSAWELADLLFNARTGEFWSGLGYIFKGFAALFLLLFAWAKRLTATPDPKRFSFEAPSYWHPKKESERPLFTTTPLEPEGGEVFVDEVHYRDKMAQDETE